MPVIALTEDLIFPPLHWANEYGILAVGGDLSIPRLLLAYKSGIFPWYSDDEPIIWWSPDPRFVLFPSQIRISKSMKKILKRNVFKVTYDHAFREVISQCQKTPRSGQNGTWITEEMLEAYVNLHVQGYAHSVEVWQEGKIVGGLYGVSLGRIFFGESMFTHVSNASKTGFITLVQDLVLHKFELIDCQVYTSHLESLGAENIDRDIFVSNLKQGVTYPTHQGSWDKGITPPTSGAWWE